VKNTKALGVVKKFITPFNLPYFFFPQEKVTKRTLSRTKFPNKFYARSLKVAGCPEADQQLFNVHSLEFVVGNFVC